MGSSVIRKLSLRPVTFRLSNDSITIYTLSSLEFVVQILDKIKNINLEKLLSCDIFFIFLFDNHTSNLRLI